MAWRWRQRGGVGTIAFAAALAALFFAVPAWAQWRPRVSPSGGEMRVNDVLIWKLRKPLANLSPAQRNAIGAQRLRELVATGLEPSQVRVDIETETRSEIRTRMVQKTVTRRIGKRKRRRKVTIDVPEKYTFRYQVETEARLVARGKVLATAGVAEAIAAGMSLPSRLADGWEAALEKALAIPGLAVSDSGLIVPWQEKRTITVHGAARGKVSLVTPTGTSSPVKVDIRGASVVLTGVSIGRDTIVLEREGASVRVDVAVQPYAAQIATPAPVVLTGGGVLPERIARLVVDRARAALRPLPGATARIDSEPEAVRPPSVGKSLTVAVPVTITGPEMLPVKRAVRVPVQAKTLPRPDTNALLFSNNPERIMGYQTLYVGRLEMETARLLYHHQNGMGSTVWFCAELINDSDEPSSVQVLGGDAGPVRDTVWVGYRVTSDFLTATAADSGMVIDLPAHSRLALQAVRLPVGQTLSGLMELRLLSGPPPLVRVAADRPGDNAAIADVLRVYPLTDETRALVQDAEQRSQHVYPKPSKKLTARYSVGGRWAFLSLGRNPIAGASEGQALDGNYGVLYDISVSVENPTDAPADIQVVFEPAAGLAGAVFVIDGRRVEIPRTNLPTESVLARYRMAPGEKRTILMRTLPLSGSNYPVNLVVKS